MSLLLALSRPELWEAFYQHKTGLACPKEDSAALRNYIDRRAYVAVAEKIRRGEAFPLPRRVVISKLFSEKKRVVYVYPEPESTALKMLTWLLLRTCDDMFAEGLYSFRPGRTAKDAVRNLRGLTGRQPMYAYKVDVSNYFNSIPLELFLPMLKQALAPDPALYVFLQRLLTEPAVLDRGKRLVEQKGIMAGTPQSAFFANLYLNDLDRCFAERGIPYARYSDDIILFAPTQERCSQLAGELKTLLARKGLSVNLTKESFYTPQDGWTFLGFRFCDGVVDIAPATLAKLKAKMRRKTRALARWRDRGGHTGQQAAAAFIRVFNRKLLESPADHELSWSYWFFSVINTTESLAVIDHYAQDCLRTLVSGKRTKGRYQVRYTDLKELGYQSLVHTYYNHKRAFLG